MTLWVSDGIFSGMLVSTATDSAVKCFFFMTAHRNFVITALLTTFVCSLCLSENLLIYSVTVVSSLFMNECSLQILLTTLLNVFFLCSFVSYEVYEHACISFVMLELFLND